MDINRQCRKLYRFYAQFRTFCTPLYTTQIWWNYRLHSIRKLNVAYNDIMRLLLHFPRYHRASQLFTNINAPASQAVIRNLIFTFTARHDKSENVIIHGLVKLGESDLCHVEALVQAVVVCGTAF